MELVGVAVEGGERRSLCSWIHCGCCRAGHNGCGLWFCLVCLGDASLGEPEKLGPIQHLGELQCVNGRRKFVLDTCSFSDSDWKKKCQD